MTLRDQDTAAYAGEPGMIAYRTRPAAVVAPQLVGNPGRQFCRKGIHSGIPALTLVFDHGDGPTHRLHWCADHVFFAGAYRASAVQVIDHRGIELD